MRWKNAAPHRRMAAVVLLAVVASGDAVRGFFPEDQRVEWVHIDGRKNPEMIPEWSAWEDAFSTIAGGSKLLPTSVLTRVSTQEAELILRESEASVKRTADCNERILALKPRAATEKVKTLQERTRQIRLECRWGNLHARDRVMAALNPEGRAAMNEFVDLIKAGTRVTVARSELSFFRQPQ